MPVFLVFFFALGSSKRLSSISSLVLHFLQICLKVDICYIFFLFQFYMFFAQVFLQLLQSCRFKWPVIFSSYLHSPICIQHFVFFFLPPEKVCLTILTVIFSLSPSSVFISGQGHHTEALRPVCSITADPVFPLLSPTIITSSWIFLCYIIIFFIFIFIFTIILLFCFQYYFSTRQLTYVLFTPDTL